MNDLRPRPNAEDFIRLVLEFLEGLAARETGTVRYEALMARAALQIASRELTSGTERGARLEKLLGAPQSDGLAKRLSVLSEEIREGIHDADPVVFEMLLGLIELSLEETNPKALKKK